MADGEWYPDDIDRLVEAAGRDGRTDHLTRADVQHIWEMYSEWSMASWLILPEDQDMLTGILLGYEAARSDWS